MSFNSIHQTTSYDNGANFAVSNMMNFVITNALNKNYVIHRNGYNAGNTSFDERDVFTGYARGGGYARKASEIIGYTFPTTNLSLRTRMRNAGPHKLRKLHELMKANNMQVGVKMTARRVPLFYTFERLLQLYFPNYVALPIPYHIRNWVPAEGSFFHHWWI